MSSAPVERALVIVLPHAEANAEKIVALIALSGFYVIRRREVLIPSQLAQQLAVTNEHPAGDVEDVCRVLAGNATVLLLSRVDAVSKLDACLGPQDPDRARETTIHSVRSLFGVSRFMNAVWCSRAVAFHSALLFADLPKADTPEFVVDALTPLIAEGLALLAASRPKDPYTWLAEFIKRHAPPKAAPTPSAVEALLHGSCLKSDRFEGIGKLKQSGGLAVASNGLDVDGDIGYWNFRKAPGAPVFGIGQSYAAGIEHCLRVIQSHANYDVIVCLNMREEPVVFVNGIPLAPRENGKLNDNVEHLVGITGAELTLMEAKLQGEVIELAKASEARLTVFHQRADMSNEPRTHDVATVETLPQVYAGFRDRGINCRYVRIPITDETAPDEHAFDCMVAVMRDVWAQYPALVTNCQMGRGRTTTAMVCFNLFWRIKSKAPLPAAAATPALSNGSLAGGVVDAAMLEAALERGEFSAVRKLLRLLTHGRRVKILVDAAIDDCGAFHNLRTSILDAKKQSDSAAASGGEGRDPSFWLNRALNYLRRYYYVLLFGAYLTDHVPSGLDVSFKEYLRRNWQLKGALNHLSLS